MQFHNSFHNVFLIIILLYYKVLDFIKHILKKNQPLSLST